MPIPQVQPAIQGLQRGRSRFLYGLEKVPDDRLTWSPGGEAKNALEMSGKLVLFLQGLAKLLRGEPMERPTTMPPAPTSREEARAALEASFGEVEGPWRT